jgi:hypothetical protein
LISFVIGLLGLTLDGSRPRCRRPATSECRNRDKHVAKAVHLPVVSTMLKLCGVGESPSRNAAPSVADPSCDPHVGTDANTDEIVGAR